MRTAKKLVALLLVCALMLTTLGAIAVSAASVDDLVIEMVDGQLVVTKNGEAYKTYDADEADGIKLSRSAKTGKIVVTFTGANGKARNIALTQDANISIEGTMTSVTLNKTLGDVAVSVAETATVETLRIKNSGAVEVAGTVKDVNVTTKAANVTVTQTAKVETLEAPKGVTIAGDGAANVGTTTVKEDSKPATPPVAPPPISGGDYNWQDVNPSPSLPTPPPTTPSSVLVSTQAELATALANTAVHTINLTSTADVTLPAGVTRALTINVPNGATLRDYWFAGNASKVVVSAGASLRWGAGATNNLLVGNGGFLALDPTATLTIACNAAKITGYSLVGNATVKQIGTSPFILEAGQRFDIAANSKLTVAESGYITPGAGDNTGIVPTMTVEDTAMITGAGNLTLLERALVVLACGNMTSVTTTVTNNAGDLDPAKSIVGFVTSEHKAIS